MCWIRGFTGPKTRFTRISFIWGPRHLILEWTRVRKALECKQSLASAKGLHAIATFDWRSPSHQNIWTDCTILGAQKTLQSQFSFNILTIFVGRHWRQNSSTAEQVARFQRLFPNPSWLMSGKEHPVTKILFQYSFIWNQIFPGIDNCLHGD